MQYKAGLHKLPCECSDCTSAYGPVLLHAKCGERHHEGEGCRVRIAEKVRWESPDKRFKILQLSTGKYKLDGPEGANTLGLTYDEFATLSRAMIDITLIDGSPSYDPG